MKKILLCAVVLIIILIAVVNFINSNEEKQDFATDFKNISFNIGSEKVVLKEGKAENIKSPFDGSETLVRYFGNEVNQDLDGDGEIDKAFLITQETKRGEIYFYAVGALKKDDGYVGTKAVLIGDRVAPQTTEAGPDRQIIVNYAVRKPEEAFSESPSIGRSMHLLLDAKTLEFGELVQNFEGESR